MIVNKFFYDIDFISNLKQIRRRNFQIEGPIKQPRIFTERQEDEFDLNKWSILADIVTNNILLSNDDR